VPTSSPPRRRKTTLYLAQGLDVGLRILECFLGPEKELGVTEISRRLGLHKSRAHKALRTLVGRHFLEQQEPNEKYCLGLKLFELGRRVRNFQYLCDLANPVLKPVAARHRATVFFRVADREELTQVTVAAVESPDQVRLIIIEGEQRPIHYGAIGKALLAGCSGAEVKVLLKKSPLRPFTRETIVSTKLLLQELERVRRRGYATNRNESLPGVRAVAAPVLDQSGAVMGAIGIGRPAAQFLDGDFESLGQAAVCAALELSQKIGFPGKKLVFPAFNPATKSLTPTGGTK